MPEDSGIASSKCWGEINVNTKFYAIIQDWERNKQLVVHKNWELIRPRMQETVTRGAWGTRNDEDFLSFVCLNLRNVPVPSEESHIFPSGYREERVVPPAVLWKCLLLKDACLGVPPLAFIHLAFDTLTDNERQWGPTPPQIPNHVPGRNHLQIFGQSPLVFIFLFLNNTLCQKIFGKIHHLLVRAKTAWPFATWQAFLKLGRRTGLVSCYNGWHGALVFRAWSHKMWLTSFPE